MYNRLIYNTIFDRLLQPRRFIQALLGPRQVGKTTLAKQIEKALPYTTFFVSADEVTLQDKMWLTAQWQHARIMATKQETLLIIDEIQKIPNWSSQVKQLWDADSLQGLPLKVLLLGSTPLLLQKGLSESLAGRFEIFPITHWSYPEIKGLYPSVTLSEYIYFGGYPAAYALREDEERWRRYISDSLIETTISRDILLLTRIDKPALLRRLFHFGCEYSGQIISYQKMLGQLQDVGNTTTLAHYLDLLGSIGFVKGIEKYAQQSVRQRASSPKLNVMNTALMSCQQNYRFSEIQNHPKVWGRLLESAVGAHILNQAILHDAKVYYWRERNKEVDFIVSYRNKLLAIEVKSNYVKSSLPGLEEFAKNFPTHRVIILSYQDNVLKEFFESTLPEWF